MNTDMGNMETEALQSVPKAFPRDSGNCLACGIGLPERKRRRGSPRRYCSARCRKEAWLTARGLSVPSKAGHVAHTRERLGRITDTAGAAAGVSGRTMRRVYELDRLVTERFGRDKVGLFHQDIRAGTATVPKMLKAIKSLMAAEQGGTTEK